MFNRYVSWSAAALVLSQALTALPVSAASFPDVGADNLYREQIETLADRAIVKGNPDGTYAPGKSVNRAEMLTLLYRAAGKNAPAPSKACFTDVAAGAWYAAVICDASKNGYVGGYPDGYFRPEKEVNRVEALKMIHTVLGIALNSRASLASLSAYTDVSTSAWYTPYIANAFEKKVLPVPGMHATLFKPDAPMLRGEAAAYIFNALGLTLRGASSSASSAAGRSSRSSVSALEETMQTVNVDFPFEDDGTFDKRKGKAYVFSLKSPTVAAIDVWVEGDNSPSVECRLYKLDAGTSFALEYYVGYVNGRHCTMRVSLGNGDYQMEIVPKGGENLTFGLSNNLTTGDGNDGFREANLLTTSTPKTGFLAVGDHADWYYFKVAKQQTLTLEVVGGDDTRCMIYPMADVDLYGFSGPVCNETYDFPSGTYYVGVMRRDNRDGEATFTLRLK